MVRTNMHFTIDYAMYMAEQILKELTPICQKISIAGSVRRKEPTVKDLEIVCVSHEKMITEADLFAETDSGRYKNIRRVKMWAENPENTHIRHVKGGDRYQKIVYEHELPVDIFMVKDTDYGRQLALRTGPAKYSKAIASRWNVLGYEGAGDHLIHMQTGEQLQQPFYKEEEFFEWLGWQYVDPEFRG